MKRKRIVERYAYKNTLSEKGSPTKYKLRIKSIRNIYAWTNQWGNPSYGFIMENGDTYLLVDDYGALNDISNVPVKYVNRRKDLI